MITQRQIERLVEQKAYGLLIRRIVENGRSGLERCGTEARQAWEGTDFCAQEVGHEVAAMPVGLGLALSRLDEITYEPGALSDSLVRKLTALQGRDGSFGQGDAGATAIVARGIASWLAQGDAVHRVDHIALAARARDAVRGALRYLKLHSKRDGSGADLAEEIVRNNPQLEFELQAAA
jgi:hypothetical protein